MEEEEDVEWWHKWRENRVELDPMTKDALRTGLALPVQRPFGLTLGGTIYIYIYLYINIYIHIYMFPVVLLEGGFYIFVWV